MYSCLHEYVLADDDVLVLGAQQRARAAAGGEDVLAAVKADARVVRVDDLDLVARVSAHFLDAAHQTANSWHTEALH